MISRGSKGYGIGIVTVDDWVDGASVLTRLRDTFKSPDYLAPQLPQVALELLEMAHHPDVSLVAVARLLERDAILCGEVLRVMASPMYAGRLRVPSIPQALATLGLTTVRDIVLQIATNTRVFRAKPYQRTMDQLRVHGTAVAHASRIVCRYTSFDADYAFMCGLLHDVGKAGALVSLVDGRKDPPPLEDVWHAIEEMHAEASEIMTKQWKLPAEVTMVVAAHHTVRIEGYPHPLAAAVSLADHLAKKLGFGISGVPLVTERNAMPTEQVVRVLGLSSKQLELIHDELAEKLHQLA